MKTLLCAATLVLASCFALGQQYKLLWSFGGAPNNDGGLPVSSLVLDSAGNLYGTTESGGTIDAGTVFELSPNPDGTWLETVLYNFCTNLANGLCLDGQDPVAGLAFDQAGNLYGTTNNGGSVYCPITSFGCGTVFELSPPGRGKTIWTETVLYSFCSDLSGNQCLDGALPASQLIFDASGNLYGTTATSGTGAWAGGTVFELSPNVGGWTHTTLYNFCVNGHGRICPDGDQPQAGVTFDKAGNLYGTTMSGGTRNTQGTGEVYELSPISNGWTQTVVFAFSPSGRGLAIPLGTVSFDPSGNLYSTASEGFPGGGVFELQPKTRTERHFVFNGTNEGGGPAAGVLIDPKIKALYGTTVGGGSGQGGVVFKITKSGQETVLYNFCQQANCTDGLFPYASLIEDKAGNLYGTTKEGGANNQGVVFEITPNNK